MPYMFRLDPKASHNLDLADYAARFLVAGLDLLSGSQGPDSFRFGIHNQGIIVVKNDPEYGVPYAIAQIGLTALGWDADEIRPRVDVWLRVAEQTDSLISDGHTKDTLVDESSIAACLERIVAKRRACFKGGKVWVKKNRSI